jgi:alpha-acetolactate decarboxylase
MVNWKIIELERKPQNGYVTTVHWEVKMSETVEVDQEEKTFHSRTYGCFSTTNENGDISIDSNFIPFEQLTQQTVIQWVKDKLGLEEVSRIENDLQQQIDKQKNPPIVTGKPW